MLLLKKICQAQRCECDALHLHILKGSSRKSAHAGVLLILKFPWVNTEASIEISSTLKTILIHTVLLLY